MTAVALGLAVAGSALTVVLLVVYARWRVRDRRRRRARQADVQAWRTVLDKSERRLRLRIVEDELELAERERRAC